MTDGETIWQRATLTTVLVRTCTGSMAVGVGRLLGRVLARCSRTIAAAYGESTLGALERWVDRTGRTSYTGRWLTGDRSSSVVVDLQSTWTVGLLLALVDRITSLAVVRQCTRVVSRTSRPIRRAPVRLACVAAIGFAVAALGFSWSSATPVAQVSWFVFAALGVLCLRIGASVRELAAGSVGTVLRRIFEPPALDELPDGDK